MSITPDRLPQGNAPRPVDVTVPPPAHEVPARYGYVGAPTVASDLVPTPRTEIGERNISIPAEVVVEEIHVTKDPAAPDFKAEQRGPEGDTMSVWIQLSKPGVGEVTETFRAVNIDGKVQFSGSVIGSVAQTRTMTPDDHAEIDNRLGYWTTVVGDRDTLFSAEQSMEVLGRPQSQTALEWDGLLTDFVANTPNTGVELRITPVPQAAVDRAIWKLKVTEEHGTEYPHATPEPDSIDPQLAGLIGQNLTNIKSANQRPLRVKMLVAGRTPDESRYNAHVLTEVVTPSAQYPLSLRVLSEEAVSRAEAFESEQQDDPRTWQSAREVAIMARVPTYDEVPGTLKVVIPEFSPNPPRGTDFAITIAQEATSGAAVTIEPRRGHGVVNGATEAGKTVTIHTVATEIMKESERRGDVVTSMMVIGLEKPVPAESLAGAYSANGVRSPVVRYEIGATGTDHYPAGLALLQPMPGVRLSDYMNGIITTYRMLFTASEQGNSSRDGRGLTMLTQALQESISGLLEESGYNVKLDKSVFTSGQPAPFTLRQLSDAIAETIARLEKTDLSGNGRWVNDVKAFYRANIEGPASGPAGQDLMGIQQTFDWKAAMKAGATIAVDMTGVHENYRALYTAIVFMKAHQALLALNRERKPGELPYDAHGLVDEAQGLVPDNETGGEFLRMLETSRSLDLPKQKPDEPNAGLRLVLLSQSPILPGRGDQNISWRLVLRTPPGEVQQKIGENLGLNKSQTFYLGHMSPGEGIFWDRRQKNGVNRIKVNESPQNTGVDVSGPEAFMQLRPAFRIKETAEVIDAAERYLDSLPGRIFTGYALMVKGMRDKGLGFPRVNKDARDGTVSSLIWNLNAYLVRNVPDDLQGRVFEQIVRSAADKVDRETRRAVLLAGLPADNMIKELAEITLKSLSGGGNPGAGDLDLSTTTDPGVFYPFRLVLEGNLPRATMEVKVEEKLTEVEIPIPGVNAVAQLRTIERMVREEMHTRYSDFKRELEVRLRKNRLAGRVDDKDKDKDWTTFAHVKGANAREQLDSLKKLEEDAVLDPAILDREEVGQWTQVATYLKLINKWLDDPDPKKAPPLTDLEGWYEAYRERLPEEMAIDLSGRSRGEQIRKVDEVESAFRARIDYRDVPLIDFFAPGKSGINILNEAIAAVIALQVAEGTAYERPTVEDVGLKRLIASGNEAEWGTAAGEFLKLMSVHPYSGAIIQEMFDKHVYTLIMQNMLAKERSATA